MKKILLSLILMILSESYYSQLIVAPNQTATNLANYLLGGGVTITNAQLTCPTGANGIFSTGGSATNLGMTNGIVLTTGSAAAIPAPNGSFASTSSNFGGIPQMAPITGTSSNFDGCLLEFDITPQCSPLNIRYKFASEEYPEYVNSGVNDGFGFFISGPNPLGGNYSNFNLATVPGSSTPITIDNVNATTNSAYYITNSGSTIVYDGMTTVLTGSANVTPCASYHLFIAITDGGDGIYDSGVFLEQSGISCVGPTVTATSSAAGGGGGVICAGQSATLTASGATTYSWSTGSTSSSIVVSPSTTTSYTLGGSNVGVCVQSNMVLTVTVNPAPTAVAGPTRNLTCAQSTTVLAGSGGGSYSWSGPGIVSGGTTATPTVNQAGTYSLIVTASTAPFCPSIVSTVAVTANTTAPSPTASSPSSLTCTTNTVSLNATGGGSYSWSGTGIVSGGTTANPVVNGTGPYVVTVTAANGCTATANTSVAQNITPPTPTASNSNSLNCTNTTATLTATGGGTYSWSGTGIVSGGATANPIVNGTGPYVVTVTAANGCTATANTSVTQNITPPTPTASNSNSLNCTNTTATLTATGGGTYNWSGTGIVSGGTTANPVVNGTGPYVVTVTAANGCTATANTSVAQNITPPTPTASNSGSLTCTTTSVTLTGTSGGTYNWSGPGIISGATTANPVVNLIGSYVVTVTAANGCTATANTTVSQNTTVPTVNAGTTQTLVCGVSSVTLTGSGSAGSSANWLGGVSSPTSFTTTVGAPGTYTLVVTDNTSGCTNTSTVSVNSSTNVPQATVNAITNSITCTNTVVAIGVTYSGTDPVTYIWTGPGITGSTTSSVTTANLSGTYNVTITNTSSNCQSVYSAVVPTNTTPVSASIAPSASLTCVTNTVNLSVTATPTGTNYAYSWSGPGTIINGNTDSPTVNANGNYVVTIIDNVNGCIGNFTATVGSNTIAPTLSLSATSLTTTCSTPTVTLNASSNADPNSNYVWTASAGGALSNPSISNPIALSGGSYDVVVTNTVNGCISSVQTVSVTADANIPTFTLTSTSVALTCLSSSETVTLTSTSPDLTYSWSPAPSAGGTTSTPTFDTPNTYVCVITNTLNNCSTGAAQVTVTSNTNAPTMVIPAGVLTCSVTTTTLSGVSNPTTGVSYSWSGPGIVGSTTSSSVDVNIAGNYDVILLDAANGCTNTISTSVTSNTTAPILNVTSTSTVLSCAISTTTLLATTNVTDTPTWSTPSGPATNPVIAGIAGDYIATVTDAINGCTASYTLPVSGSTVAPTADAGISAAIPCGTPTVTLNGTTTSTDVVTYNWSGPNTGSILAGTETTSNPIVMDAGVYTLTVTNTASGCSATATINVTQANVNAAFTANPTNGLTPLDVNFTDASTGVINNYNWDFGDGSNSSSAINPNHTFTTGTYTVTLTVSSGPCVSTATTVIVVEDGLTLEIPNVFTPNGDGSNEIFYIKSTGVKEISLQIFNRWGQKLYEFTGPKASWDGLTPGGADVPEGTYFYFVKATGFDDQEIEKHGSVNLFR